MASPFATSPVSARKFSSRHVPFVAEELAEAMGQDRRFRGLMNQFKQTTNTRDERRHIVLKTNWEAQVPMEHGQALRDEFQRRCNFGECYNMEFLTSAKFVRLLQDCQVLGTVDFGGQIRKATADILYKKVLFTCEKGADRIGFPAFCKLLALVAATLWPDAENGSAFTSMILKVLACSPDAPKQEESILEETMLDAGMILAMDDYKPQLFEVFRTYALRGLPNASVGGRGLGAMRCQERAIEIQATKASGSSAMSACSTQIGSSQPTLSDIPEVKVRAQSLGSMRGGPALSDRSQHMSLEQTLTMCRSLGIVPDLLSGKEVLRAYQAAQGGSRNTGSRHGLLCWEEFVDAVERMALMAYGKKPFSEMYPEPRERVCGFLDTVMRVRPLNKHVQSNIAK